MAKTLNVMTTSASTASVEDVRIDVPPEPDTTLTRKIARPELVDNAHSDTARVKVTLVHQKRHKKNEPWEDADNFLLSTMKAGQEIKLILNAAETYNLYETLRELFAVTKDGIPRRNGPLTVVDSDTEIVLKGREAEMVRRLTEESSEEFWDAVQKLEPYLFQAVALTKLHEVREQAVNEFFENLEFSDWNEPDWQGFFERNTWIFGYGLDYRFLSSVQNQPYYGGKQVSGKDGQRGDFLTASEADHRFTVLVEIKRPDSLLVEDDLYRNKVYRLGEELIGGVSQLQSNCRTWETEGSRTEENREQMLQMACHTLQPKGVLIIGCTSQLDDRAKRSTFELFRRNLQNPEVITFDELYERARHLLLIEGEELSRNTKSGKG